MEKILVVLEMIGGLVLFLYGMDELGVNLKKVSGSKLELILEKLTSNKWKGALLGMLVTAVIQSSGATIVMVVGFVNSQIMTLQQTVGVILGANIGTTITAWLLSLTGIQSDNILMSLMKPRYFSPVVGLIGLIMIMSGGKEKKRSIGGLMVSFAVLMLGMTAMSTAAAPLAADPAFTSIITAFSNPIIGLLAGLAMTAVLQSSSASVGILQAVSMGGTMTMGSAIPVIMGENIGSAITGVLSALNASRNARRASMIQMIYCILKTGVFMVVFYSLNAVFNFAIVSTIATPVSIAVFHSVFNVIAVLVMLPLSDILVKIVMRMFPTSQEELVEMENRKTIQILDEHFLSSPAFALEQCKVAMNKMSEHALNAMNTAMELIFSFDSKKAAEVDSIERRVDEYEDTLDSYMIKLSSRLDSKEDSHTLSVLLHCVIDFERITDHALNIMQSCKRMDNDSVKFTPDALEEMRVFTDAVADIMNRTVVSFRDYDFKMAKTVEPLEEVIDGINMQVKDRHIWRMRKGECSIDLGLIQSDITTNLERVADHCSNIAVCLLSSEEDTMDTHKYLKHERSDNNKEFIQEEHEFETLYKLPDIEGLEDLDDMTD